MGLLTTGTSVKLRLAAAALRPCAGHTARERGKVGLLRCCCHRRSCQADACALYTGLATGCYRGLSVGAQLLVEWFSATMGGASSLQAWQVAALLLLPLN
jgi:hypothetical protein